MARSYANIATAIWRDDEFRALSMPEQYAYLLLTSQPDISAAGVLSLNLTRWSSRAKGCNVDELRAAIDGLEDHRFVVVDYDTEELLVRSFVRWDNGYSNPKRRPVIRDASGEIESMTLRRVLAIELERVGLPGIEWTGCLPDSQSDRHADSQSDSLSAPEWPDDHLPESSQVNRLSDSHADTVSPSERVVVTTAMGALPQPSTRNQHSALRTPPPASLGGRADEPPPARCPEHIRDLNPPPCGACADARRNLDGWERRRVADAATERSTQAHQRAEAVRAEIDACDQCGPDGYLDGGRLCRHDAQVSDRVHRGATAARAVVGKGPKARTDTARPGDPIAEASANVAARKAAHAVAQQPADTTEVS